MSMLQDARAGVAGTAGGLLLVVSTLAIAPTAVHAQRTPAPTGLEVTGTSAAAEVILKGSVVPDVGPITAVQTLHQPFNPPTTFTASTLATSIPLQRGQTVSVTVTIGFQ